MNTECKPMPIPIQAELDAWRRELVEREAAPATVEKYLRDARAFVAFLTERGLELSKASAVAYKEHLVANYAPASVNSMIAALNGFARFLGHPEVCLRQLKIQKGASAKPWLSKADYKSLVRAAKKRGDLRYAMAIQVLCATGIRVSELEFVTVEAVRRRWIEVTNKGKTRRVWLPAKLCKSLYAYVLQTKRKSGPVFVTRTGRPIDRTRIWRKLKEYAMAAGVDAKRVYPHALRHLFATTFYRDCKDIDALSLVLVHSRIETTRIYIGLESQAVRKQIDALGLVV